MELQQQIDAFLANQRFGVVGASADRNKYGNKVLRCYRQNDLDVVPVNPNATEVEGIPAIATLTESEPTLDAISVITPPHITETIVEEAVALGIGHIWMQPGAESESAVQSATENGINVISGGPCLLVVLGYRERP